MLIDGSKGTHNSLIKRNFYHLFLQLSQQIATFIRQNATNNIWFLYKKHRTFAADEHSEYEITSY